MICISRFALVLVIVACSQAHSHHHHNRSRTDTNHAANVLGIVSGALGLVRDTASGGARVVANNPATREVISTAVDGVKEVAEIATDPRPIFPGTRWCGAGTRAEEEEEIGIFEGTDACCRDHDNCDDNIKAGQSKHGLNNTGSFTVSHCDCDEAFYRCLKSDGSIVAKKVGFTYFDVLRPRCFRQAPPIKRCAKHVGVAVTKRCEKYEFDEQSKNLLWQWFDAESF